MLLCCAACQVFVGPCESSVFIRDCSDCALVVAAQQLRLRDCHRLSLLLYVGASQPVLEASDDIRLSAFSFAYPQLSGHFDAAHLHPFNCQWANVHDFHHAKGEGENHHFTFLPYGTSAQDVGFKALDAVTDGRLGAATGADEAVVPNTWGERPFTRGQSALLLLGGGEGPQGRSRGYDAIRAVRSRERGEEATVRLLRSRCVRPGRGESWAAAGPQWGGQGGRHRPRVQRPTGAAAAELRRR